MERSAPVIGRGGSLLVVVLALELALAAVGMSLWARSTFADEELEGEAPTLAPSVPRPVTLESAYPLAAERARQWDADARLILVSAQIDWPLEVPPGPLRDLPGGGWLTYVFVRESDGEAESLGLLIERYSGQIAQEQVAPWGGPAPVGSLDLTELPFDSVAALVAAEGAGGTEFRRACPGARHQTRISLGVAGSGGEVARPPDGSPPAATPAIEAEGTPHAAAAGPIWLLGYRDVRDEGRPPLVVTVDANSGAVSVEERMSPEVEGCPV